LSENDKKYKDKKDRYNLNLKDVKTDFRAIVAEDVAKLKTQLLGQQEQKLHLTEGNLLLTNAKSQKKDSENSRQENERRKHKGQKEEPINPEFSPIASENNSVNFDKPNERTNSQPKNLFRNLIQESKEPKMKTMLANDVIDLVMEDDQENDNLNQDASQREDRSSTSRRESYPIRGIGNIYRMLGQLPFWQTVKKNVQENPRYKREDGSTSLTAFAKKVESNYTNLKIFYPQITDMDINEFMRHYKYINVLIRMYVAEKLTYANIIDLIKNPGKKLRESGKKHSKSKQQTDTMLTELFEEYDNPIPVEPKKQKSKIAHPNPTDSTEPQLAKSDNRGQPISPTEEHPKKNEAQSGSGDLFKRIKMATEAASTKSAMFRVLFPKNNRIIFMSDDEKPREIVTDQLLFLSNESQLILDAFPYIERPPKIRLNQFKKPVSELEREFRTQDSTNPSIIVGVVEIDTSSLDPAFSSALLQKFVWGYACAPNLNFYICHVSAVSNHTFDKIDPILDSSLFAQNDFSNVFVFFLKKVSNPDKPNSSLKYIAFSPETTTEPPTGIHAPQSAFDKFNLLLSKKHNQNWAISNAKQNEQDQGSLAHQSELPRPLPVNLPFSNSQMIMNPNGEPIASKGNTGMPLNQMLDPSKQFQQQFAMPPGVFLGSQDFGVPQPQSDLLSDLRQSNLNAQTNNDVGMPPNYFVNQPQPPFFFPPGMQMPLGAFGGSPNMPPMMPGQFMGMPFFNPMAMNAAMFGQNPGQIPLMVPGANANEMPMMPQQMTGQNILPGMTQKFSMEGFNPSSMTAKIPPAIQNPYQSNYPADYPNTLPNELPNHPMPNLSNMTFNFENANEENEEPTDITNPDTQHLHQQFPTNDKLPISKQEASEQPKTNDEDDQELIELVRDNDAATLAECYTDADESLQQLLLDKIRQYAPEKVELVMQMIRNK
jgi:hypothetical protein